MKRIHNNPYMNFLLWVPNKYDWIAHESLWRRIRRTDQRNLALIVQLNTTWGIV